MNAAIFQAIDTAPVMETWLQLGRRARLIVAADDLVLHWSNAAGEALLERRDPLLLHGDTVRPRHAADGRRFQEFVAQAGPEISVLCLADHYREEHLLAAAVRLPGRMVGLTAAFASAEIARHWADLREVFGLTASERDIAQALSSGLTAEAVAHKLNTSVKTVRTHIRRVYSKLDVCSREELFHKLVPYMITD